MYVGQRLAARGDGEPGWPHRNTLQFVPEHKGCAEELGEQSGVFGVCLGLAFQYYSFRRML